MVGGSVYDAVSQLMRMWTWCFSSNLAVRWVHHTPRMRGTVLSYPPTALTIGAGGVLLLWDFGVLWYLLGMDKAEYSVPTFLAVKKSWDTIPIELVWVARR